MFDTFIIITPNRAQQVTLETPRATLAEAYQDLGDIEHPDAFGPQVEVKHLPKGKELNPENLEVIPADVKTAANAYHKKERDKVKKAK